MVFQMHAKSQPAMTLKKLQTMSEQVISNSATQINLGAYGGTKSVLLQLPTALLQAFLFRVFHPSAQIFCAPSAYCCITSQSRMENFKIFARSALTFFCETVACNQVSQLDLKY